MIAMTLIAIAVLYSGVFIIAAKKIEDGRLRIIAWLVLSVPIALWIWDYPVISYQHAQACKVDGGMRKLRIIEKADRIRLIGSTFGKSAAESYLQNYYPRLQVIEAVGNRTNESDTYFAYTIDPISLGGDKWKYKIIETAIPQDIQNGMYWMKKTGEVKTVGGYRTQLSLGRGDEIYAQWVSYRAIWNAGGILPNEWQCFMESSSREQLLQLITQHIEINK